ncbi:MAG: site-specific integrase [Frisingicoccus sp.]
MSRKEQEKLCQYLYSDLNACNIGILISLFTGLRVGEICALRWEDISISEQTIHICRTMQRIQDKSGKNGRTKIVVTTPKSPCSIRTIPIPEELMQILISFQTSRTGYFLTGSCQKYMEPRTMQNRFKAALKNCSVSNANYHALRHTFATRCVELGFDVKSLSEILGHANVNITMNRYVHPSMELKKANMQRLSGLFIVK